MQRSHDFLCKHSTLTGDPTVWRVNSANFALISDHSAQPDAKRSAQAGNGDEGDEGTALRFSMVVKHCLYCGIEIPCKCTVPDSYCSDCLRNGTCSRLRGKRTLASHVQLHTLLLQARMTRIYVTTVCSPPLDDLTGQTDLLLELVLSFFLHCDD